MAVNNSPIFTGTPDVQGVESIVTANNTLDLTSGTSYLAFTAGANGAYLSFARIKANPANNTAATVMRFWLNNGSTLNTSSNSFFIGEISLPATTASASAALADWIYPLGFAIPAGWRLYVTVGTAPGGSGELTCTVFGGSYVAQ